MPVADEIPFGTVYGRLTLLNEASHIREKRAVRCRCICGKVIIVRWAAVKLGRTVSCGCYNRDVITTHGGTGTRIYQIWVNLLHRCTNPTNKQYAYYGGKGITVCDAWQDFHTFKLWAESHGYDDTLTIERKDSDKNYEPNNCCWVDRNVQAANRIKRRTGRVPYLGLVPWHKRWAAFIMSYGKRTKIGVYDTPEEARDARNAYIKQHGLPHMLS